MNGAKMKKNKSRRRRKKKRAKEDEEEEEAKEKRKLHDPFARWNQHGFMDNVNVDEITYLQSAIHF